MCKKRHTCSKCRPLIRNRHSFIIRFLEGRTWNKWVDCALLIVLYWQLWKALCDPIVLRFFFLLCNYQLGVFAARCSSTSLLICRWLYPWPIKPNFVNFKNWHMHRSAWHSAYRDAARKHPTSTEPIKQWCPRRWMQSVQQSSRPDFRALPLENTLHLDDETSVSDVRERHHDRNNLPPSKYRLNCFRSRTCCTFGLERFWRLAAYSEMSGNYADMVMKFYCSKRNTDTWFSGVIWMKRQVWAQMITLQVFSSFLHNYIPRNVSQ